MTLAVDISMIGDKKLEKALGRLAGTEQKKIVRRALRQVAKPIAAQAKQLVPVDTGDLKRSIKVRAQKFKGRNKPIGVVVIAGAGLEDGRAAHVELGTKHGPAQSYLRATADAQRSQAIASLGARIGAGIERLAKQ